MTQFRINYGICLVGWSLLVLHSIPAMAGSLRDAEEKLDRAHNQYYEAVRTGKASTPSARSQLKKNVVTPAASQVGRTVYGKEQELVRKLVKKVQAVQPGSRVQVTNEESVVSDTQQRSGGRPESRTSKPETALDGRNVKKLIEFEKGARRPSPLPKPKKGAGVKEVQF